MLRDYLIPSGSGANYEVKLQPYRQPGSFFEESIKAAKEVWNQRKGKIFLLYSGGLDSEYVLRIFMHLKLEITPVILRMSTNGNNHDIKYALNFCKQHNLNYEVIDLDIKWFLNSGTMIDVCHQSQNCMYRLSSSMWLADQLYDTVVLGGGPYPSFFSNITQTHRIKFDEWIHAPIKYWKKHNIHGVPRFCTFTQGLFYSFFNDPLLQKFLNNNKRSNVSFDSYGKILVYNNQPHFKLEDRPKFHGWEKIDIDHPAIQTVENWRHEGKWAGRANVEYESLLQKNIKKIFDKPVDF